MTEFDEWVEMQLMSQEHSNYHAFIQSVNFNSCPQPTPSYRRVPEASADLEPEDPGGDRVEEDRRREGDLSGTTNTQLMKSEDLGEGIRLGEQNGR